MHNEIIDYKWSRYSSYYNKGEAHTKSIRLGLMFNKPTKIEFDPTLNKYWILIAYSKPIIRQVNHKLID